MSRAPAGVAPASAVGTPSGPWTVLRLMLWSADYLRSKGVESPRLDAEHLLAHVLGVNRLEMYLQHERPLTQQELDAFRPLLRRRAAREPLQYVLGRQAFRELDLVVRPGVLIPRPETEMLVEAVLEWARASGRTEPVALDLGTGTGAIALSLLAEGPFARAVATDVSPAALEVARENAAAAGLAERLDLREGPFFDPVGSEERFDAVVSNPPYVAEGDRGRLAPEVAEWEPAEALFAGPEGLEAIARIVPGAARVLRPGGLLALEVGEDQAARVRELIERQGDYEDVRVVKDLARKERIVTAVRRDAGTVQREE
ncbi:MAG TPA: peptide chain release factor N(5)-glutamine methyltransferase [Longimicrobiales bacterium]|nr:peptide chain release factor N(5)-glutamine methyltransferase [Longimicrobiales bacterium]